MHSDDNPAAQHDKLTLGKIYDSRGVVDDVKADRHNSIDNAIGNAGKKVLYEKFRSHWQLLNTGKGAER
jgi:hypothetical protein